MLFIVAITVQFNLYLQLKNLIPFSSHDGGTKRLDFDGTRFGWKAIMVWVVNTYIVVIQYYVHNVY